MPDFRERAERNPASGAGGRRFKSCRSDHFPQGLRPPPTPVATPSAQIFAQKRFAVPGSLPADTVAAIAADPRPHRMIAELFGVAKSTVYRIKHGKTAAAAERVPQRLL